MELELAKLDERIVALDLEAAGALHSASIVLKTCRSLDDVANTAERPAAA